MKKIMLSNVSTRLQLLLFFLVFGIFSLKAQLNVGTDTLLYKRWDSLYQHSETLLKKGKYAEGVIISQENLVLAVKIFPKKEKKYRDNLYQSAQFLRQVNNNEKALAAAKEQLAILDSFSSYDTLEYAKAFNLAGLIYINLDDYIKSEAAYKKAMSLLPDQPAFKDIYASILNNISNLYALIGVTDKALIHGLLALEKTDKTNPNYLPRLANLAKIYKQQGNYDKAITFYTTAVEESKLLPSHAIYLNNLGITYTELKFYPKALATLEKAIYHAEKTWGASHVNYGIYTDNLSYVYSKMGDYAHALEYGNKALAVLEKAVGKDHTTYNLCLAHVASYYGKLGQPEKALDLLQSSLAVMEKKLGKKHQRYLYALYTLANVQREKGDKIAALTTYETVLKNSTGVWDKSEQHYLSTIEELILLYNETGTYQKSIPLLHDLSHNMNKQVRNSMDTFDEKSKELFIDNFMNQYIPILYSNLNNSFHTAYRDSLASLAYDAALVMKGSVLQSTQRFKTSVEAQQDSSLNTLKAQRFSYKNQLSRLYSANAAIKKIDSLEEIVEQIDNRLIQLMPSAAKNIQKITQNEVKKALDPNEIAIEFIHFRYHNGKNWTDSIVYGAMILQPNQTAPRFVYLCEEKQLRRALTTPQELYGSRGKKSKKKRGQGDDDIAMADAKKLYQLIWKPIQPILNEAKKIYYAPSGLLHRVAFAALPNSDTTLISDSYQLYTLSSTKELVHEKQSQQNSTLSALMLGGIRYDADTIITATTQNEAWNYLSGTATEIKRLQKIFIKKHAPIEVKEGAAATEDFFKTIGGTHALPTILHIATHGFFFPSPDKQTDSTNLAFQTSDNPLIRSGLILAGANGVWQGKKTLEGHEDGVLTAYEIANMNLFNIELVALSACETGLGDIKNTEGVYGLQRAFKMAGVKYILMSLWQVPDKQTTELMENFYTHWLNGKNINDAFREAQNKMKEKYPPYYWAGFVLLH